MANQVCCPKCGSSSISANKRGYNVAKGVGGLLIPGGVLWGLHGSNKIIITCLNCGHKWSPTPIQTEHEEASPAKKKFATGCAVIIVIGFVVLMIFILIQFLDA